MAPASTTATAGIDLYDVSALVDQVSAGVVSATRSQASARDEETIEDYQQ